MRKFILFLLIVLLPGYAFASSGMQPRGFSYSGAAPPAYCTETGDIYSQSMEGTAVLGMYADNGTPFNDEVNTTSGTYTIDGNYTTWAKAGTDSFYAASLAAYAKAYYRAAPASITYTQFTYRAWIRIDTSSLGDGTEYEPLLSFYNGSYTNQVRLYNNGGNYQLCGNYYQGTPIYAQTNEGCTTIAFDTDYLVEGTCLTGNPGTYTFKINGDVKFTTTSVAVICGITPTTGYIQVGVDSQSGTGTTSAIFDCVDANATVNDWLGQ